MTSASAALKPSPALQMHGSAGLHSAMAIKRQRRLREQAKKRAQEQRERRLSSRTSSMDSMEQHPHSSSARKLTHVAPSDQQFSTSVGMLHLGVCFVVLGLFLVGSGLLPDDVFTWRGVGWWNELVMTGGFVLALGVFLIVLNRYVSKKEEEDLNEYVQRQLTRSRSGHRLERDAETGCLTTKNHRRLLEKKREDLERGLGSLDNLPVGVHSPESKTAPVDLQNGEAHLEKIMEEDVYERAEIYRPELELLRETVSTTTTASLSPGTPSETRELLSNGRHHHVIARQH